MPTGGDPDSNPIPAWALVLDAIAIAALLVAAFVVIFGSFVAYLGPWRLSSHSMWRPLLVAAASIAVRHAIVRRHPVHERLIAGFAALRRSPFAAVGATALASRLAVLLVGYLAVLTVGPATPPGWRVSDDPLINLPARFDAGWYTDIALDGYFFKGRYDRQQNIAFFPAYPMMMRAVAHPLGALQPWLSRERGAARILWVGVLISVVAFVWAAVYFARLAREMIGEEGSIQAVALLAAYPFAIYFSAAYTESVFLLETVAAFYHFRRRDWIQAALWGALVGLTRPNGCLLTAVLVCLVVEDLWRGPRTRWREYPFARAGLSAMAPTISMLAHTVYMRQLTGDWFGWARVQVAWGRSFQGFASIADWWYRIRDDGLLGAFASLPVDALNVLALVFALLMVWPVFRRVGFAGAVLVVSSILPPLMTGGVLSMARFTSTLFPIFIALAAVLPRSVVGPIIIAFAIGQGFAAVLFFTGRPLF